MHGLNILCNVFVVLMLRYLQLLQGSGSGLASYVASDLYGATGSTVHWRRLNWRTEPVSQEPLMRTWSGRLGPDSAAARLDAVVSKWPARAVAFHEPGPVSTAASMMPRRCQHDAEAALVARSQGCCYVGCVSICWVPSEACMILCIMTSLNAAHAGAAIWDTGAARGMRSQSALLSCADAPAACRLATAVSSTGDKHGLRTGCTAGNSRLSNMRRAPAESDGRVL